MLPRRDADIWNAKMYASTVYPPQKPWDFFKTDCKKMIDLSTHAQCTDLTANRYNQSLRALSEKAAVLVPAGWQACFCEMLQMLHAANDPCRSQTYFDEFKIENGALTLEPLFPDRTVHGIVRKYGQKLTCTCMLCGKPGHKRQLGFSAAPLCAQCYAMRALRSEINVLLQSLELDRKEGKDILVENDFSPRCRLALADAWEIVTAPDGKTAVRCISAAALQREVPRLRALNAELNAFLQGLQDILRATQGAEL